MWQSIAFSKQKKICVKKMHKCFLLEKLVIFEKQHLLFYEKTYTQNLILNPMRMKSTFLLAISLSLSTCSFAQTIALKSESTIDVPNLMVHVGQDNQLYGSTYSYGKRDVYKLEQANGEFTLSLLYKIPAKLIEYGNFSIVDQYSFIGLHQASQAMAYFHVEEQKVQSDFKTLLPFSAQNPKRYYSASNSFYYDKDSGHFYFPKYEDKKHVVHCYDVDNQSVVKEILLTRERDNRAVNSNALYVYEKELHTFFFAAYEPSFTHYIIDRGVTRHIISNKKELEAGKQYQKANDLNQYEGNAYRKERNITFEIYGQVFLDDQKQFAYRAVQEHKEITCKAASTPYSKSALKKGKANGEIPSYFFTASPQQVCLDKETKGKKQLLQVYDIENQGNLMATLSLPFQYNEYIFYAEDGTIYTFQINLFACPDKQKKLTSSTSIRSYQLDIERVND